jgi:outer membrane cobalamin receptor
MGCVLAAVGAMGAGAENSNGTFESPHRLPDSIVVTANRFGSSETQSVWPTAVVELDDRSGPDISLHTELEGTAGVDIRNYNGMGSVSTLSNWGVFNRHMLLLYNGRVVKDYSLGGFNLAEYSPNELQRTSTSRTRQRPAVGVLWF